MTAIKIDSDNPIGASIDLLAPQLTEQELASHRAVETVFTTTAKGAETAASNPSLTAFGQREEVTKVIAKAREALKPHQAEADRLAAIANATREQALRPPAGERTSEMRESEREIRDRFIAEKADPLQVFPRYLSAIENRDWRTIDAIERAPSSFPLLTTAMLEKGAELKLKKSPLAAQLAAQEAAHRRYAGTLATARTELARLARQHGLTFEA